MEDNLLIAAGLRDYMLEVNPPFLGYLSACLMGANKVDRLVDEGIHLVSAFQLAGLRGFIDALYEVSDGHCVDVAAAQYEIVHKE